MSCTYLARHELESVNLITIILVIVIVIVIIILILILHSGGSSEWTRHTSTVCAALCSASC